MPVLLYMDVHVPQAITDQLRRRGINILTALEDGYAERDDPDILDRARTLERLVFTQDIRFKAMAETWQKQGRAFAGLLFGHQLGGTIGQYVHDELIASVSEPQEWVNVIEHLPFKST
jgi:hypothetical protein